jgi:SAM-dependent methyltransferase
MSISQLKCRICDNTENNKEHIATEMMYGTKEKFSYTECGKCGCVQISQIPSNLSTYYPSNYDSQPFKLNTKEKIKLVLKSFLIKKRFSSLGIYRKLFSYYQGYPFIDFLVVNDHLKLATRILDVGCASGGLLMQLKYLGFKFAKGIDPFISSDIYYSDEILVHKKYLSDVNETYDLIMLNHSFEHMENPEKSLGNINQILSSEGCAFIRVPVASSFAWKNYGVNWVQMDVPRHLYLHTVESMKALAMKTGFEIVSIHFDSTEFQFWGSEQYIADIPLDSEKSHWSFKSRLFKKSSIFTKQQIKEYKSRAMQLNEQEQGDQACFVLKKRI